MLLHSEPLCQVRIPIGSLCRVVFLVDFIVRERLKHSRLSYVDFEQSVASIYLETTALIGQVEY